MPPTIQSFTSCPHHNRASFLHKYYCLVQVQSVLKKAVEKFGRVDGVADCAGSALIKPAHLSSAEEFHDAMAQNVLSAFNILKASVRTCPSHTEWHNSQHPKPC